MPKFDVERTEYVRNPERQLGLRSAGLWLADDADRIVEWASGKALIFTREDVFPWLIIGNLSSARDESSEIPTMGSAAVVDVASSPLAEPS
jgi:hypothetical protein